MLDGANTIEQIASPLAGSVARATILVGAAVLLAALLFVIMGRLDLALVALISPLGLVVITSPKLALYGLAFCIFLQIRLIDTAPVYIADVGALLVVFAGLLDWLLDDRLPAGFPPLTGNFLILLGSVGLAALFSVDPSKAASPLARISLLTATFMAIYRLSGKVGVEKLCATFFWIGVAHALYVLVQYVAVGGTMRVFGFSQSTFGTIAMTAFPIGLAYAFDEHRRTVAYQAGSLILLAGILATQSRFPLLICMAMAAVVVWMAARRHRLPFLERLHRSGDRRRVLHVVGGVGTMALAAAAVVLVFQPTLLAGVWERFGRLWSLSPSGTLSLRVTLWLFAIRAFMENPLLGIGPGCFRYIQDALPYLRLEGLAYWVRGLSAHNLFLHYLAETGLIGASALAALTINQYRMGRQLWRNRPDGRLSSTALALSAISLLFLVTTFAESGWLWGQAGFAFAFFLALIARTFTTIKTA